MKNQSPKKSKKIVKFIVFILLVILLAVLIKINYTDAQKNIVVLLLKCWKYLERILQILNINIEND